MRSSLQAVRVLVSVNVLTGNRNPKESGFVSHSTVYRGRIRYRWQTGRERVRWRIDGAVRDSAVPKSDPVVVTRVGPRRPPSRRAFRMNGRSRHDWTCVGTGYPGCSGSPESPGRDCTRRCRVARPPHQACRWWDSPGPCERRATGSHTGGAPSWDLLVARSGGAVARIGPLFGTPPDATDKPHAGIRNPF